MTTQPTPHIGATLAQRAILRYRMQQRELEAERERLERTTASLQVDALLDAIYHTERLHSLHRDVVPMDAAPAPVQPEPVNFCAPDDGVPPAIPARKLIAAGLAWLVAMLASLWLCTEAGMRFLDAIWRLA